MGTCLSLAALVGCQQSGGSVAPYPVDRIASVVYAPAIFSCYADQARERLLHEDCRHILLRPSTEVIALLYDKKYACKK